MNIKASRVLSVVVAVPALLGSGISRAGEPFPSPEVEDANPVVQVAILLDTSGSMSGLIDQAKSQLWKVVNEFISAKQKGKAPVVQVALYEYGKSSLKKKEHWIRQIQPLTRDLDKVSEELFALATNGGDEYCGAVIERAVQDLAWDFSKDTFKTIFIAGNEPFTQGPIDPKKACQAAIESGITVNTIHCGSESDGLAGKWKMGALMADGSFLTIDQNKVVAHIEAPQDEEIEKLNEDFNATFIVFGRHGATSKANQLAQDANASSVKETGASVQRVVAKASSNYFNARWDLCDASDMKGFKIEEIKEEDLPENMRKMTMEERKAYIESMKEKRKSIEEKILTLNEARKAYVAEKRKEEGEKDTLDAAMITALRSQAGAKGIQW